MAIFKSAHFWSVVGIFVVAGLEAIVPQVQGVGATIVQVLLGAYAVVNHNNVVTGK